MSLKEIFLREFLGWKRSEVLYLLFSVSFILVLSLSRDSVFSIIAAVTGCFAAILTGQGKLGAFVFGIVNSVLYGYISYKYHYYGEVLLKFLVFIPLNFYGIYSWNKNFSKTTHEAIKRHLTVKKGVYLVLLIAIVSSMLGIFLKFINGNLPFVDAFSTVLAVFALILCIKRYCEHWLLWVVINCVNIYLWIVPFFDNGVQKPYAILLMWIFYLVNSIIMYYRWYSVEKIENKNGG